MSAFGSEDYFKPFPGQISCVVRFDAYPSFEKQEHWCIDGRYLLSWTTLRDDPVVNDDVEGRLTNTSRHRDRRKVYLPRGLALEIQQLWLALLLDARVSASPPGGLDGTNYVFGAVLGSQRFRGDTWSYEEDLPPKWTAELGNAIVVFSRASDRSYSELRTKLRIARSKIYSYYEKRGSLP
jgi:hypothetical protein